MQVAADLVHVLGVLLPHGGVVDAELDIVEPQLLGAPFVSPEVLELQPLTVAGDDLERHPVVRARLVYPVQAAQLGPRDHPAVQGRLNLLEAFGRALAAGRL